MQFSNHAFEWVNNLQDVSLDVSLARDSRRFDLEMFQQDCAVVLPPVNMIPCLCNVRLRFRIVSLWKVFQCKFAVLYHLHLPNLFLSIYFHICFENWECCSHLRVAVVASYFPCPRLSLHHLNTHVQNYSQFNCKNKDNINTKI